MARYQNIYQPLFVNPENLIQYHKDIGRYPLLNNQEEKDLVQRVYLGDKKAFNKLIVSNLRFVIKIAYKYRNNGLPLSDLINEGNLGLVEAVRRVDPNKKVKFVSYGVWWIRQSIRRAIFEKSRNVRPPTNKTEIRRKIERNYDKYIQELNGKNPSYEYIAKKLGISEKNVVDALKISNYDLSLDSPINNEDNSILSDVLADNFDRTLERVVDKELNIILRNGVNNLPAAQKNIVSLYFGLEEEKPLSLADIGERLNLSKERVRQVKEQGLENLRKPNYKNDLSSFLYN